MDTVRIDECQLEMERLALALADDLAEVLTFRVVSVASIIEEHVAFSDGVAPSFTLSPFFSISQSISNPRGQTTSSIYAVGGHSVPVRLAVSCSTTTR
jgi:hypothetical protein